MTRQDSRSSSPGAPSEFNPKLILDMNYAFAHTALLVAATRLRLFTHLSESSMTAAELAAAAGTEPYTTRRVLAGLQTLGLVELKQGDLYHLTPVAAHFLVEGKPTYLGGDTLAIMEYLPAWFALDAALRTGKPYRDLGRALVAEAFFAPHIRDLFPVVYPIATRLAAALELREHQEPLHVLDVGAGSGAWSAAFVERYPTAHVTAVDLPAVVAQGKQQIDQLGLSRQFTWVEADITTLPLEAGRYDLIIVAHICRFLGEQTSRDLLKRLFASCAPGGVLVIAETLLLDDRSGPPFALLLDISMAVNTSQGRLFSFAELAAWLRECGFQEVTRLEVMGPSPIVVARKEANKSW